MMCSVGGPAVICVGNTQINCNPDGTMGASQECSALGQVCAPELGCRACLPGRGSCMGNTTQLCRPDGSGFDPGVTCDASIGESCNPSTGTCASLCREAEMSNSYIGCEYWPTPVLNSGVAPEFEFAVVIANPQTTPAEVRIDRNGISERMVTVPAGGLETVRLPWVDALKGVGGAEASALVIGGAYRVRSSVPVTVYQFNALDYRIGRDCLEEPSNPFPDGQCFSYTNDASLLLPTHVLTGNYLITSRASMVNVIFDPFAGDQYLTSPGFFAVIGVEEVPVSVSITFSAHVQASVDGSIRAFAPGETGMFMVGQGDVLQIVAQSPMTCPAGSPEENVMGTMITYCRMGPEYDLTGSEVRASGRVAVIGGHNCAFVPFNRWACDHLEETMFPLEAWGTDVIISASQPLRSEPNVIRVVSGRDGNMITFDPAVMGAVTLNRGQFVELESMQDVRIVGTEAISVSQFLVGQDYAGVGTSGLEGNGDPGMSLGIPTEQFRTEYTILAPDTYEVSYVNVTALNGQDVFLDGAPIGGWRPVGATGMQTARQMISGGQHQLNSGAPFGIIVYGFGSYTSYIYPGGLDLEAINIPF
jgi:hypothetical protein